MRLWTAAALLVLLCTSSRASASEPPSVDGENDEEVQAHDALDDEMVGPRGNLRTRAEEISFDARLRTVELRGNVRVDAPPFHLRSQQIKLTRTGLGIEIVGDGSLAFCPCLGTPLKVDFKGAIVAPPGDLILERPTLRFYDIPILPLPYFWLRGSEKVGVLPPDIAWRGHDGMFVGAGVHLPWKAHGDRTSLDLRGGAYLVDGFVADARLLTANSFTKIRYDRLPSDVGGDDGLLVDARGSSQSGDLGVAWDADVLRGERGIRATTELDAAARPYDRASIEAALRGGPLVVATAMRAVTRRGGALEDVDAAGPVATVRASGAAGAWVTYDATMEGGSLRYTGASVSRDALSFARAELGVRGVLLLGPLETSLALRGAGDVTTDAFAQGDDRAASARARVGLPLERRFSGNDPWIDVIDPFVEVAGLHARGDGMLGLSAARGGSAVNGTAPIADVGVDETLGRWGTRDAFTIGGAVGSAFGARATAVGVRPLARARASASMTYFAATGELAEVLASPGGQVGIARVRLGKSDGVRILANVAARDGVDPVLARALVDAPLEPAAGFLTEEGTTGGAGLVVPWTRWLTTSVGADGDAVTNDLVAVRGGVELRDRCGCLTLRANASHRVGREGVDVWIALDFAADR